MASWAVMLQFRHSISSRERECTSWCFFSKLMCCCSETALVTAILVSQGCSISSGYETHLTLLKRSRELLTLPNLLQSVSWGTTDLPRVISSKRLSLLRDWISILTDPFLLITKCHRWVLSLFLFSLVRIWIQVLLSSAYHCCSHFLECQLLYTLTEDLLL